MNAHGEPQAESERLNAWLDRQFERQLDFNPEWRTRLGEKKDYDRLSDVSQEAADEQLEWFRESVATMRAEFDYDRLSEEAKTSYDLWAYQLEIAERSLRFRRHYYTIGRGGVHAGLPNFMVNFHQVDTVGDMRAYNSRLREIGRVMRQTLELAQIAAQDGIRPPQFDYDFAIDEIDRVVSGEPFTAAGSSPLWEDANRKVGALVESGQVSASEGERLLSEAHDAMTDQIAPSYAEMRTWLEGDRANADEEPRGAWSLPDGEAYYEHQLYVMTTLELGAEEIHETGLAEVDRITAEMESVKSAVGFQGTLQELFAFMREDPQFYLPDTDEGRQAYIDLAEEYLDGIADALPDYFGLLPEAELVVRRVESFREQDGAAQHYMRAAPDGSRPAVFYAHLSDMSSMPRHPLESITYHEGVPGHHLQISIAQELEDIPRFRTQYGNAAFSEGWALYAEALAKEMGFYRDPYSEFGRLDSEMMRAIRLVVDTGLHVRQWTQAEAAQYFRDHSSLAEGTVRSEVQRYLSGPAQATAYKIGMLKIQELRQRARQRMGGDFDIRRFHDAVLGAGALPLPVLQARIERWISDEG